MDSDKEREFRLLLRNLLGTFACGHVFVMHSNGPCVRGSPRDTSAILTGFFRGFSLALPCMWQDISFLILSNSLLIYISAVHRYVYFAVIKSRRMRWAGHVVRMEGEVCTRFWWGNLRERDHWGDQDVDGRIILRWIFRKWEGVVGTGWSWLRIGTGGGRLWVR